MILKFTSNGEKAWGKFYLLFILENSKQIRCKSSRVDDDRLYDFKNLKS